MTKRTASDKSHLRRKDDILLKAAFEEVFPDLLRFCFPEEFYIFDFSKEILFMDKELRELFPELHNKGGNRFVDMLAKVFLKDGREEWVLVHIEIQGSGTRNFPARMFQYWYRIYDRYGADITAIAILTGNKTQKRASSFSKTFLGTKITYEYNVYHILDHTEVELLETGNPFALVVLAAQKALLQGRIPEEDLLSHKLTVAKALIGCKKLSHKKIERFLFFLQRFIHIENEEINRKFDEQINQLTGKKNTMDIIETIKMLEREEAMKIGLKKGREEGLQKGIGKGIEEGIEKKNYEVVRNLLINTDFNISRVASLAGVSTSFVKKVRSTLVTKKS